MAATRIRSSPNQFPKKAAKRPVRPANRFNSSLSTKGRSSPQPRSHKASKAPRTGYTWNGLKRTSIKHVSDKLASENAIYVFNKCDWREDRIKKDGYLRCEFVGKPYSKQGMDEEGRCMAHGMDSPHHKMGRLGPFLTNRNYFMCDCFFHHDYIETHKRDARKRGYILYK